ncbi:Rsp5p-dependent ubiquitination, sorting of cargo proteins at the multivesicular body [Pichia californica]|nr:Rsp5p-dependent ubiquitination, sorting of cargo proteins at the multivesicular body [[Candida] californica]
MDDSIFLIFLFGITTIAFLSLILLSYLIFCFIFKYDDNNENELPENLLPNQMKININNYLKLSNFNNFLKLNEFEKINYLLSITYLNLNKPKLIPIELSSNKVTTESLLIRDRGINSFHFLDYYDQINLLVDKLINQSEEYDDDDDDEINETTSLISTQNNIEKDFKNNNFLKLLKYYNYKKFIPKLNPYIIEDLIEINFKLINFKNLNYSTILNLPIPTINRKNDVIYFETKLLEFNKISTLISIGLVTDPNYPNFQLPGYLPYSFAIESNGNLRITKLKDNELNKEFEFYDNNDINIVLPQLNEGDIIGIGYRSISGTIFLTHNGKLIYEIIKYFKFQLYPCIGIKNINNININNKNNKNCKINVNLGQLGFVYIEANVKKFGFCENKNDGLIGAPPIYNKMNQINEILLDKGDDIPPDYPTEENSFFGKLIVGSSNGEKIIENNGNLEEYNDEHNDQKNNNKNDRKSTPVSEPPSYESEKLKNDLNDQEYEGLVSAENTPLINDDSSNNNLQHDETTVNILQSSSKSKSKSKKAGNNKKGKKKKNKTLF